MYLLETILSIEGVLQHLSYHEKRLQESYQALYNQSSPFTLLTIKAPMGIMKCRIIYDKDSFEVTFEAYTKHYKHHFHVLATSIDYEYKYLNREYFSKTLAKYPAVEDIIFTKDNYITDTTIANIACLIDGTWFTPEHPLLKGTTRQRLLDTNFLQRANITLKMLQNADSIALMNALTGFYIINNPIIKG